jgi:hypothetical protein
MTSFHNVTIKTTANKLMSIISSQDVEVSGDVDEKYQYHFYFTNSMGEEITIYDWKEYRAVGLDEVLDFHIGSSDFFNGLLGKEELVSLLN